MKILLATAGSRGDVEPFAALARRAAAAGHTVRLAMPDNSGVTVDGLDVASLGVDYSALIADQGVSPFGAMRSFRTVVKPTMRGVIVESTRIALDFGPDVIVSHPKVLSAPMVAEHLDVPHVLVEMVPAVTPTREFAAPGTTTRDLGRANRWTYAGAAAAASMFRDSLAEARALAGATARKAPAPSAASLVPVSPHVLRRPADWPDSTHLTGPWFDAQHSERLQPEVEHFIGGAPFVYAGFGSMAAGDARARGRAIIEAARSNDMRVLIATGWGGIEIDDDLRGDDVLVTVSVPHAAVLPRASAALHHGGIGTVHAAARAGSVSIVVPFIADQPFWGAQLQRLGLSPTPIPHRRVTTRRVSRALEQVDQLVDANQRIATAMSGEDGVGAALDILESIR